MKSVLRNVAEGHANWEGAFINGDLDEQDIEKGTSQRKPVTLLR